MWFGQQDAPLARTIEREIDALHRVALRLTRESSAADDLVQETCLRAWRGRRAVRDRDEHRSWLFRILRNAWIDGLRKARRSPTLLELTPEVEAVAPADVVLPPIDLADRAELERCLDREVIGALDDLTDEERLAVLFHAFADMSYHEIGEALECPLGTVMSRLHRGRAKLRERLAGYAQATGVIRARPAPRTEGGTIHHGNI